ncbi:hypothetical protein VF21_06138 [Pseudogymnoascus sp. 05NY08]|nr:hypothetical protein VF21_06138 [Pseudogymnoascus sp. 05NY08]
MSSPEQENQSADNTILEKNKDEEQISDGGNKEGILQEADAHEYVTGIKLFIILAVVTLVFFLLMLDMSIVTNAIPAITNYFHSLEDLGWYGSVYPLASAALQPLTGKIYTYYSSKWTFFTFFVIFEIGSAICGAAVTSAMLIIGRTIAGLAASGLMTGALTILSSCVPKERQPGLMGIMMGIGQLGVASGPLIGGALTQHVSWRWCFYINLPVGGVVAGLLFMVSIPEQVAKPTGAKLRTVLSKMDLVGFAIFAPASVMFFLALQFGGEQFAWNSSTIIGLFCGAGVMFIVFFLWEWRQVQRLGYYLPWFLAAAIIGSVGFGLLSTLNAQTSTGRWIGYLILNGIARGMGTAMPIIAIQNTLPLAQISVAMSILVIAQNYGGAVFIAICQALLTSALKTSIPKYAPSVNAQNIINAGATGFRAIVSADDLPGVLAAYSKSISHTFYLGIAASIICFITGWGMGLKDVRKKKAEEVVEKAAEGGVEGNVVRL